MYKPLVVGFIAAAAFLGAFSLASLLAVAKEAAAVISDPVLVEAGVNGATAAYNAVPIQAVAHAEEGSEAEAAADAAAEGGGAAGASN